MEIIVAIIIVAVLAAIAVPNYQKATETMRSDEGKRALTALLNAQYQYHLDHDPDYAVDLDQLAIDIPQLKHFDALDDDSIDNDENNLAVVNRSSDYTYSLSIDDKGIISCTGADCAAIGM